MAEHRTAGKEQEQQPGKTMRSGDLRTQKTRKALENAFYELSETVPIENITVSALCEKAMVRRATFYKHFSDIFDFFEYVTQHFQSSTNVELKAHPKNITLPEFCTNICRGYLRNYHAHPKMVRKLNGSKERQSYQDILFRQNREAILKKIRYDAKNGIELLCDEDVIASMIGSSIGTIVYMYEVEHIPSLPEEEFLTQIQQGFELLCAQRMKPKEN